jgi:hypothetical protein
MGADLALPAKPFPLLSAAAWPSLNSMAIVLWC